MNTRHNVNKHADKLQPHGGATEITHNAFSHNGNMKLITSCPSCELRSLYNLWYRYRYREIENLNITARQGWKMASKNAVF